VADVWSQKALEYGGRFLRRAVADADDVEARGAMMLAASMAGVGFGSAGVHIPHACAYPIAGLKHATSRPATPTTTRSSRTALGDRHRAGGVPLHLRGRPRAPPPRGRAARGEPAPTPGPDALPDVLRALMRDVGAPRGIAELGYGEDDIAALVEGALKQQRLLANDLDPPREDARLLEPSALLGVLQRGGELVELAGEHLRRGCAR
jgi:hydroxyacid-oxoacid transhydrogenase